MNVAMFIVGFVIFTAYVILLVWNIFHSAKKNREENYPNYYSRHGQVDDMDTDGMGNFSRFPKTNYVNKKRRKRKKV